ncbi:MAG: FAD-binding protein [Proteobacteria bacterium]|nr:MAG: FAD-binding protein [Pseudomonadota bacterium]
MSEYDYVIVGAGSAGCVLAAELARAGHPVLVLEAGGGDRRLWVRMPIGYGRAFFDRRVNWCYRTGDEPNLDNRSSYWPRGKVVGGSSSINAMVYYRGLPGDFDDWAKAAGPQWSWRAVESAFEANECVRYADGATSGSGPMRIVDPGTRYHRLGAYYLDAAARLGLERNPRMISGEGVGRYCITADRGVRCSAADAFLKPGIKRYGLSVLKQAHAARILFDGSRATGVEFRLRGETHRVYCRNEVIVCAGAVNSPQLLQLSGVGPGALLARHGIAVKVDSPATGGNLQDHLAVTYFYRSRIRTLNNQLHPWWGKAWAGLRYVLTRGGPLALGVNQYGGFVRSTPDAPAPDIQLYFNPITYTRLPKGRRPLLAPDPYPGYVLSFQPCRPFSRGRVDIQSNDPFAAPDIRPRYLSDGRDIRAIVDGARLLARLAAAAPLRDVTEASIAPAP